MTALTQLVNTLPLLAILAVGLTGLDSVPAALAHPSTDHHRQLAARLATNVDKHTKKKRRNDGKVLRRRSDGTVCKAQDLVAVADSTSSSTVAPSSTSSSEVAVAESTSSSTTDVTFTDATSSASSSEVASTSSSAVAATTSVVTVSTSVIGIITSGGWTNTGYKFGAAWPNGDWAESTSSNYIGNYIGIRTSWYYTWSPFCVSSGDSLGLEFVPMLWGTTQISDWWAQMDSWPSTVKNALFFNEPNQSGQADISAADSVQYWMNDYLPVRSQKGVRLGGAATTSADTGLQWVLDFTTACTNDGNSAADCTADFIPVHYYDTSADNFQTYVSNFHDKTGVNLWVTEYACEDYNGGSQCTDQETWNFHIEMAAWFDEQSYVERYSPFGMMEDMQGVNQNNALMNPDGSITSLGGWYITTA